MYHWYALDVEQTFDSLSDEIEGDMLQEAKAQFINGYKTEHLWTKHMEETLPLMRRFCNLFSYTSILRIIEEHFCDEPDWLLGLRERLGARLKQLESSIR